ncbi:MAG: hypothetical protein U1F36_20245 [Planctomycetota bacterium]
MTDVVIRILNERPAKPPLIRLIVELRVSNPTHDTRWVLLCSRVPGGAAGGVNTLEQFASGPVQYGRFLGTGGFHTFALAPGASLTLKNLEIGWWNGTAAMTPPPMEVRTATEITIGGESINAWFRGEAVISGAAEIDVASARAVHTRSSARELEVELTGATTKLVTAQSN